MNSERVRESLAYEILSQPLQGWNEIILVTQGSALPRATLGWQLVNAEGVRNRALRGSGFVT